MVVFSKKIARIALWLKNCKNCPVFQKKLQELPTFSKCYLNGVKMAVFVFFSNKIARIAKQMGALPPGPRSGNLSSRAQSSPKSLLEGFQ